MSAPDWSSLSPNELSGNPPAGVRLVTAAPTLTLNAVTAGLTRSSASTLVSVGSAPTVAKFWPSPPTMRATILSQLLELVQLALSSARRR